MTDTIFQQFFEPETSTYTYLVADPETREAALIDPVLEMIERDLQWLREMELKLVYALDTHLHADHITAAGQLRSRLKAKTGISAEAQVTCSDLQLQDGQILPLGKKSIRVIATPGHTQSCVTYQIDDRLMTGDALLIRGCGRTDFQGGSSETLYRSIHTRIFSLPDTTRIYPGHDYKGQTQSTVGLEKKYNPRLGGGRSLEAFRKIMEELRLAEPQKIHQALPANMSCGELP